jgi:small basic protein
LNETDPMKRAISLGVGGLAAGTAIVAMRHWRRTLPEKERALLEFEILAALDEVDAARALLNAEFARRL